MQVTAAPPLILPLTNTRSTAAAVDQAVMPLQPEVANITADKITITQTRNEPVSYDNIPVYISGIRDTSVKGVTASAIDRQLVSSLNSLGDGKAPFTISNFFSQVNSLSNETLEYRNEARRAHVSQEQAIKSPNPNFSLQATSEKTSARLSIRTKDGDTIQIEISQKSIGVNQTALEFSFVVDGSLSDAEKKALGELATKLGEMGDEFFRSDTTELRNLKGIDTSVISHFSFTLRRPSGDSFAEHSYEFSVDETAETQTLRATDVRGYSVDVTTSLNKLVENSIANADSLQPYLELIRQATDDVNVDNKSRRFMLDAFESMFDQFINLEKPSAVDDAITNTLAAFDSGLPDFKASIRSQVSHNPGFYRQAAVLSLTMEQQTRFEANADSLLVKQESRYELTNNRFEALPGSYRPDLENGNYRYVTERIEGSFNRILSMTGDRVNNLLIEQTIDSKKEMEEFRNFKMVDKDNNSYSDRKLQQFAETLSALNQNNQYSGVNDLLVDSKKVIFLPH